MNLPSAEEILRLADDRIRTRVIKAHRDETALKGGSVAALGYKAALTLARDSYEMGMRDALKAIDNACES